MGKGSNDPILNRYMPKTAKPILPELPEVVASMPCRDEAELLACQNVHRTLESILQEIDRARERVVKAKALIERKIKTYQEEL